MFKKITLAAVAMMSVAAMAQTTTTTTWTSTDTSWSKKEVIDDSLPISDKRMEVIKRARKVLSGGDAYEFTSLLDRAPTSVDLAIVEGLFDTHREAIMIQEQRLMTMYPTYTSMYTTSSTDSMGNTTTTTTTTTSSDSWAMSSGRPLRMVMESSAKPKDIDYLNALSILSEGLSETQKGVLANWWSYRASERQKDVLVKLVEDSAGYADHTYYPSVYTRRTWTTTSN
jgi:molybdopterin-guanine dinucleotide biosynthesis protein